MKNLILILSLTLLPLIGLSQFCKPSINAELGIVIKSRAELRAYGTYDILDYIKAEGGFGITQDHDVTYYLKNKFRLVEQDGFSVYLVPFWIYGRITDYLGYDVYNSLEVDYQLKKWIATVSVDYPYTYNYEDVNQPVTVYVTIKRKLF